MKPILIICLLLIPFCAHANFIEELESRIADEQKLNKVVVSIFIGKSKSATEDLEINSIEYDGKVFRAHCLGKNGAARIVGGKYEEAIEVAALNKDLRVGQIISEEDIGSIKVAKSKNLKNAVTNSEELIGKEARHNILADKIVSRNNLRTITIVSKGDEVKIIYRKNNLQIEARGQVLESGGQDEFIRVKNLDSNKTLQARVVDSQTVLLGSS